MAKSVTPVNTQSGLLATAFFTGTQNSVVIVNPSSTSYAAVRVVMNNAGFTTARGKRHLLNGSNYQIATNSLTMAKISGGYSVYVKVPAYSTVAVTITP